MSNRIEATVVQFLIDSKIVIYNQLISYVLFLVTFAEFHPAQPLVKQMLHKNTTLQRRAGQRWLLASRSSIRKHAGRQPTEKEATGTGHEQEERPDERQRSNGRQGIGRQQQVEKELRPAAGGGVHVHH